MPLEPNSVDPGTAAQSALPPLPPPPLAPWPDFCATASMQADSSDRRGSVDQRQGRQSHQEAAAAALPPSKVHRSGGSSRQRSSSSRHGVHH